MSAIALNRENTGIALGSDLPRSRPFGGAPRSQHMHIKYIFTMQQYVWDATIAPDADVAGGFAPAYGLVRPCSVRGSDWEGPLDVWGRTFVRTHEGAEAERTHGAARALSRERTCGMQPRPLEGIPCFP
jgi:hypothetical protein